MEESIKNRIILILSISTLIFFLSTVNSCKNARQSRINREKEMATRLDAEEKRDKFAQEKAVLEDKLKNINEELEKEKTVHEATKKALQQESMINQSLKEELEKVTKLKEKLEEDLKEALVASKSEKSKK